VNAHTDSRPSDRTLWFGIVGPPLAWATQLVAGYAIEETACPGRGDGSMWKGSPDAWTIAFSAACGAVALAALVTSWRSLSSSPAERGNGGRVRMMATAGVLSGVLFLVTIAIGAGALVSLDPCEAG
jgi:hypothetical protein